MKPDHNIVMFSCHHTKGILLGLGPYCDISEQLEALQKPFEHDF